MIYFYLKPHMLLALMAALLFPLMVQYHPVRLHVPSPVIVAPRMITPILKTVPKPMPLVTAPAPAESKDFNSWGLGSTVRPYTCLFTGKVVCGTGPCSNARVQVVLNSDLNSNVKASASVGQDGEYSLEVSLDDRPNEVVDWSLTAQNKGMTRPAEESGCQILTEKESTIQVEKTIQL